MTQVVSDNGVSEPASGRNPRSGPRPSSSRLFSLEAGRGVAACLVVFYHASRHLDKGVGYSVAKDLFQFGHAGVDFFFVISGFIILFVHGADIGRPERLSRYVSRRCSRIFPVYWTILAVTIALQMLFHPEAPLSLTKIVVAVGLLPVGGEPVVGVAWTLQHEMIFYVLFATAIMHRWVGGLLLGLWLAAILSVPFGTSSIQPGPVVSAFNLEFFLGMAAALWLRRSRVPYAGLVLLLGLAMFIGAAVAEVMGALDGYQWPARLAYGIPSAVIILGLVELDRGGRIAVPGLLRHLGAASYSIYLFHLLSLGLFYKFWSAVGLLSRAPLWVSLAAIVIAGIVGGVVVSRTVEYPLIRLARHKETVAVSTSAAQ